MSAVNRKYLSILAVLVALFVLALLIEQFNPKQQASEERVRWEIVQVGEGRFSAPLNEITVIIDGKRYALGTYAGSCGQIGTAHTTNLLEGEVSAVQCRWGGGGYELGVFTMGPSFGIKQGFLDEGASNMPGVRGSFENLFVLP